MKTLPHRYIVVEGPIGVGKTHLVKRLADSFSGNTLLEAPEQNPFLERYYLHPKQSALPTQLSFLMQRVKLAKTLQQDDYSPHCMLLTLCWKKTVCLPRYHSMMMNWPYTTWFTIV